MQINIDKKSGIFIGIILVLLAIIMSMGMSRNDGDGFFGTHGFGEMGSDEVRSTMVLSGADIMFLQMMIPHHQQAVDISDQAIAKSKDTELIALATDIVDEQRAEIIQMKSWLRDADAEIEMGHSMGQTMGGMLTEAELSELKSATGNSFDLLWLQGMINHHDGAVHMSSMIRDAKNAKIKSFGENVVIAQTAQIEQMRLMVQRLG